MFADLYDVLEKTVERHDRRLDDSVHVTLSVESMPLPQFLRYLAQRADISVIAAEHLDNTLVTVDAIDQPATQLLAFVARRIGAELTSDGSIYYLGDIRSEDRGLLVRKVTRLTQAELEAAVRVLLSDNGKVAAYPDGLLIIGDRVAVLDRLADLLDQVEQAPSDSWIVQLHYVVYRGQNLHRYGLDVTPAAQIALTMATASSGSPDIDFSASATLDTVLRAASTDEDVSIITQPSFVLSDGSQATYKDGLEIRVRRFVTSPEGTVTPSDIELVETGTDITVSIRELGSNRARLGLDSSMSDVVGQADGLPQTRSQTIATQASITAGGVYLIAQVDRRTDRLTVTGPLQMGFDAEDTSDTLQVWARAYRIAPPVADSAGG